MKSSRWRGGAVAAVLAAVLAACGGGGSGPADTAAGQGTLRVALTDAPACGYDAVWVTVQKVRVHRSASAGEQEAGWSEVVLAPPQRIDLLGLQNGLLAELGQLPLEPGHYQQLRLVLADTPPGDVEPVPTAAAPRVTALAAAAGDPANAVAVTGDGVYPLQTPSALKSGLKLNVDLRVEAGRTLDLVLDFDACKSVLRSGAGSYRLKPVVSVLPRLASGVRGAVAAGWPAGATQVSLQQAGTVVKSTAPDAGGAFALQPVAPGSYTLVVAAPGQATLAVTGVTVSADTLTTVGTSTSALPAAPSADGTLAGTVATGATPVEATTRALQALAAGLTVELAAAPVDASTGAYRHVLAVAAPRVAAWVAPPAVLAFTADTAAAGKVSLQAVGAAGTKTVGPLTLAAGATTANDVTLP